MWIIINMKGKQGEKEKRGGKHQQRWVEQGGSENKRVKERNRNNGLEQWRNEGKKWEGKAILDLSYHFSFSHSSLEHTMTFTWQHLYDSNGNTYLRSPSSSPTCSSSMCLPKDTQSHVLHVPSFCALNPTGTQLLLNFLRSLIWFFRRSHNCPALPWEIKIITIITLVSLWKARETSPRICVFFSYPAR